MRKSKKIKQFQKALTEKKKKKRRLVRWKGSHLSFGGIICLIKIFLKGLSLFYLPFFEILVGMGKEI